MAFINIKDIPIREGKEGFHCNVCGGKMVEGRLPFLQRVFARLFGVRRSLKRYICQECNKEIFFMEK